MREQGTVFWLEEKKPYAQLAPSSGSVLDSGRVYMRVRSPVGDVGGGERVRVEILEGCMAVSTKNLRAKWQLQRGAP